MRRFVALLLSSILTALPLAGMAGQASADAQDRQEMQDMKDMPCHQGAPKAAPGVADDCNSCNSASLCCAIFIPPAAFSGKFENAGSFQIPAVSDLTAGVDLPPLDPPPLAS